MITMLVLVAVLVVLGLAVVRYGADTRSNDTADHRDPALPRGPQYGHTPASDVRLLAGLARRVAAQRQAWAAYDRSMRPWETQRSEVRPVG
ncbi:hypothetical protein [Actinomycetospora termitidis]|uniref:Secreted protein n=1 Tax=Actinomycetospora termitidis TaxID=3053470 RepID=A0ABT7MF77_9PSEU|nr:hypothetical protein [Actinomycetospora sp. Odt1-22]MDL5158023.1 hypothetical protein [Actinomycetospora sp. Odt1-22]